MARQWRLRGILSNRLNGVVKGFFDVIIPNHSRIFDVRPRFL